MLPRFFSLSLFVVQIVPKFINHLFIQYFRVFVLVISTQSVPIRKAGSQNGISVHESTYKMYRFRSELHICIRQFILLIMLLYILVHACFNENNKRNIDMQAKA